MSLVINPLPPCRIGKRPPAPENRPAIEESAVAGGRKARRWWLARPDGGNNSYISMSIGLVFFFELIFSSGDLFSAESKKYGMNEF